MSDHAKDKRSLKFDIIRKIYYHDARYSFLSAAHRWLNFAILMLGTATAANLLINYNIGTWILGAGVTLFASMQYVFNFSAEAHHHQSLKRDYAHLLADLETTQTPDQETLMDWTRRNIVIASQDRPALEALNAICYNKALDALYEHEDDHILITRWQSFMRHCLSFNHISFKRVES